MVKRFTVGDIHGRFEALKDVLKKSKFDYEEDILIVLGDIADGGHNTSQVVDELSKIKNLIFIIGNHDKYYMDFIFKGKTANEWINQGGANTLNNYGGKVIPNRNIGGIPIMLDINGVKIPKSHAEFFTKGVYYFKFNNMLFIHGGFNPKEAIENQDPQLLMWDRELIHYADKEIIKGYDKVFIGHTSTQYIERNWVNYQCRKCGEEWEKEVKIYSDMRGEPVCSKCKSKDIFQSLGCTKPLKIGNLYCVDCGAGWDGKLVIMDINSEEFWQSKLQEPPIK